MDVEFLQDDSGLVMFYHAQNIWIRCTETKAKYIRSATVTKHDPTEDHLHVEPKELVRRTPERFWANLHQGCNSLDRQLDLKEMMRLDLTKELSELIAKNKLNMLDDDDGAQDREDIVHLLKRVNRKLKERP